MVRVFFPSMFMRLISWKPKKVPPQALLHVPPSMTKFEISQYLTKIYDVNVQKVQTANFLGLEIIVLKMDPYSHPRLFHSFVRQMEAFLRQEENFIAQATKL
jgi:hypothetical protein